MGLLDMLNDPMTGKTLICQEQDVLSIIPEINRCISKVEHRRMLINHDKSGTWTIEISAPARQIKSLVKTLASTYRLELTADDSTEIVKLVRN